MDQTANTIKGLIMSGYLGDYTVADYKRKCRWDDRMTRLLTKEPKSWQGFSFMPKGEVS